jgi:hypothetical protein
MSRPQITEGGRVTEDVAKWESVKEGEILIYDVPASDDAAVNLVEDTFVYRSKKNRKARP